MATTNTKKKTNSPLANYLSENQNKEQSEDLDLLDKYYGTAQSQIDANREASIQNADIAFERAKKYLPMQNKSNGLTGLGVSETATLDMYNQHMNRKANIDSSYNATSADLFKNYTNERQSILDKEYERKEAARLEEKEDAERARLEEKEDAERARLEKKADDERAAAEESARKTENYNRFIDMIDMGTFTDVDALANEINQSYWAGDLTEEDYKALGRMITYVRESPNYRDKKSNLFWYEDQNELNPNAVSEDFQNFYNSLTENGKTVIRQAHGNLLAQGYPPELVEYKIAEWYVNQYK